VPNHLNHDKCPPVSQVSWLKAVAVARGFAHHLLSLCIGATVILDASAQVVRPIPALGRIEAENYNTNGPSVSYYDDTLATSVAFIVLTMRI
jgi:hypothetical protein